MNKIRLEDLCKHIGYVDNLVALKLEYYLYFVDNKYSSIKKLTDEILSIKELITPKNKQTKKLSLIFKELGEIKDIDYNHMEQLKD